MAEEKKVKLTFYQKQPTVCPVCENKFQKEDLMSGGGRMNAGDLTKELHREYRPTGKFGKVYPLLYPVTVCPSCYYAAFPSDFQNVGKERIGRLKEEIGERKSVVKKIFPGLDFQENRGLAEGIASYILSMMSYESAPVACTPTLKQALSCIRASWLSMDFHKEEPGENYDYLAQILYRKAAYFYTRVVELEQSGNETVEGIPNLGPDIDNNYGFDGVMYLAGYLEYKYGQRGNTERRGSQLKKARSTVSRIVGMGKSSKSKPSALLELARDLHKAIKEELDEIGYTT